MNQPQVRPGAGAAKPIPPARAVTLAWRQDCLSVQLGQREDIIAAELVLEGLEGSVALGDGMAGFLVAWRAGAGRVHVALAGPVPAAGPGELVHIQPTRFCGPVRLTRAEFNDGGIQGTLAPDPLTGPAPTRFALHPNTPNPFNLATQVRYELPYPAVVELEVVDLLGQHVRTLVAQALPAGVHQVGWDGRDEAGKAAASGVYLCWMRAGSVTQVRPMLLLR